eukprot:TRINITY_DN55961_c0_g1_i1.p1 TRINITY_DN55961_c0_g1~~TRINITY_DN55961_c0_g1_i1.p1  ORF type:complete len:519 (-),score=120.19 TRINITY_DN55961_c0_g1_i1:335-1891(-)
MAPKKQLPALGAFVRQGNWKLPDFVMEELERNGNAWTYAHFEAHDLKKLKNFIIGVVKSEGRAFEHVGEEFQADPEVLLAALSSYGRALQYASQELRSCPETVLAAVKTNGSALQFASQALRGDRELVIAAIEEDGSAIQFASNELRADKQLVLIAVAKHSYALQYASSDLKADREVVIEAVKQSKRALDVEFQKLNWKPKVHALEFAAPHLRGDREVILAAVSTNGNALELATEKLRSDRDVVLAAVKENERALRFAATREIKRDPELVRIAARALRFDGPAGERVHVEPEDGLRPSSTPATPSSASPTGRRSPMKGRQGRQSFGSGAVEEEAPVPVWADTPLTEVRLRIGECFNKTAEEVDDVQLTLDGEILSLEDDRTLRQITEASILNNGLGIVDVVILERELALEATASRRPPTTRELHDMAVAAKDRAVELRRAGRMNDALAEFAKMHDFEQRRDDQYAAEKAAVAAEKQALEEARAKAREEEKQKAEAEAREKAEKALAEKMAKKKKGKWG